MKSANNFSQCHIYDLSEFGEQAIINVNILVKTFIGNHTQRNGVYTSLDRA